MTIRSGVDRTRRRCRHHPDMSPIGGERIDRQGNCLRLWGTGGTNRSGSPRRQPFWNGADGGVGDRGRRGLFELRAAWVFGHVFHGRLLVHERSVSAWNNNSGNAPVKSRQPSGSVGCWTGGIGNHRLLRKTDSRYNPEVVTSPRAKSWHDTLGSRVSMGHTAVRRVADFRAGDHRMPDVGRLGLGVESQQVLYWRVAIE